MKKFRIKYNSIFFSQNNIFIFILFDFHLYKKEGIVIKCQKLINKCIYVDICQKLLNDKTEFPENE